MTSASKTDTRSARTAAPGGRRGGSGDLKSVLLSELQEQLRNLGEPSYRAGQILDWLYKKRVDTIDKMTNLPRSLRSRLAEKLSLGKIDIVRVLGSHDTTRKFLFRLTDGNLIESVLIPASPALYGGKPIGGQFAYPRKSDALTDANFARAVWKGFRAIWARTKLSIKSSRSRRNRGKDRQHCFHGDGRATCQFEQPDARDSDH